MGNARRQVRSKRPRIVRLAPLAIGLAVYLWAATIGMSWIAKNAQNSGALLVLMVGIMASMFGLLTAGPYLTRLIVLRTLQKPPTLLRL